jgi:hypothetical protein
LRNAALDNRLTDGGEVVSPTLTGGMLWESKERRKKQAMLKLEGSDEE